MGQVGGKTGSYNAPAAPAPAAKKAGKGRAGRPAQNHGGAAGNCRVVCLDEQTGKLLWSQQVGSGDPNCTPTIDGDRVYALGRNGELACLDSAMARSSGPRISTRDFGGNMMSGWGYSESPLVDGDKLLCTPGARDAMIVALDKKTGDTVWKGAAPDDLGANGTDGAGYSSIVISHGAGVKQYVQLVGRGIVSFRAEDGKFLWNYNRVANQVANIPTPLVEGDYVFASTGYQAGAALLELQKRGEGVAAKEVYFLPGNKVQNHHGGMVLLGDYVYMGNGHNNGFPLCLELKTGKIMWSGGRGAGTGSAAVLEADGELYFRYQDGVMALIEANPEKYVLKGKFKLADSQRRELAASGNCRPLPLRAGSGRPALLRHRQTLRRSPIVKLRTGPQEARLLRAGFVLSKARWIAAPPRSRRAESKTFSKSNPARVTNSAAVRLVSRDTVEPRRPWTKDFRGLSTRLCKRAATAQPFS